MKSRIYFEHSFCMCFSASLICEALCLNKSVSRACYMTFIGRFFPLITFRFFLRFFYFISFLLYEMKQTNQKVSRMKKMGENSSKNKKKHETIYRLEKSKNIIFYERLPPFLPFFDSFVAFMNECYDFTVLYQCFWFICLLFIIFNFRSREMPSLTLYVPLENAIRCK